MKDFNYDCEKTVKLTDKAIVGNFIKSVMFNGQLIRGDSNTYDSIIVPQREEANSQVVQNDVIQNSSCCTEGGIIEDSRTPPDDRQISNIQTIIENYCSSLQAVETRFIKIEDHMIELFNPIYVTNPNTTQDNIYTNLLKNRITELEKQLANKNAVTDFLLAPITSKPSDLQKNNGSDDGQVNNIPDYDNLCLKKSSDNRTTNLIIIGDSLLNNVNSRGLSKSKKVEVLNFSRATSADIYNKIDDIKEDKLQTEMM